MSRSKPKAKAQVKNAKPTFIFFAMIGCPHCEHFIESGVWDELKADPELSREVNFKMIEFGSRKDLPAQYDFVDYAPYFYMEWPDGQGVTAPDDLEHDFDDMKDRILATHEHNLD